MKRSPIEKALASLSVGFALLVVWISATAAEQTSVVLIGILVLALNTILTSILVGFTRFKKYRVLPVMGLSLICACIMISAVTTDWPLRAAYAASRRSLDALESKIRAGEQLRMPRRAGFFTIRKAEVYYNGIVCLWTGPDPAGNTGFVR